MAESEVDNVDIVTHACSVGSIIVTAENAEEFSSADCNLCDIGNEVVGDSVGVFTDSAALVSTDGVKVAEKADALFVIRSIEVLEDSFDIKFCCAVGVCCFAFRHIFFERRGVFAAVNGCR